MVNSVNLSRAEPLVYTLSDCLQRAAGQNRTVLAARFKAQSERHKEAGVFADYFPKIQAQGVYFNAVSGSIDGFFAKLIDPHPTAAQLIAVQPVTQLVKIHYAHRIAGADRGMAESDEATARAEVAKSVKQLYWKGLELYAQRDAVAASLRYLNSKLADAEAAEKAGKLLPDAVREVEANLIEAQKREIEVKAGIESVRMNLAVLLGLDPATEFTLSQSAELAAPSMADALERTAAKQRPEVCRAEFQAAKAGAAVALAKTGYIPDITVAAGEFRQKGFPFLPVNGTAAMVTLQWNLFDWGKRENEVAERKDLKRAAELQAAEQRDKVRVEVRQALNTLETVRGSLALAEAQRRLAQERLRIVEDRRSVDKATQTDVLEARMRMAIADAQAASARSAYNSQAAEVERAAGV
ncbi:MAG TPA: TolC family protein [Bryobacteraceae bacterium]|nr:TolC family protein [Bryobacteraceae bacterium]